MKIFRHNSAHDGLVHLLIETPHKSTNQAIFATKRDLLCFAAVLGFEIGKRGKIQQKPTDFVDPRIFENSQEAMNLLYLIGLAETKDADCLREDNEDKLVEIFEEYADTGLTTLQEWLRETPSDPQGDRAIIGALKTHGYLTQSGESAETVIAEVEF